MHKEKEQFFIVLDEIMMCFTQQVQINNTAYDWERKLFSTLKLCQPVTLLLVDYRSKRSSIGVRMACLKWSAAGARTRMTMLTESNIYADAL
jgi:hypothetical protein